MRVLVIGAGRLGGRLAEELVANSAVTHVQLWNRSSSKQRGMVNALRIWAFQRESPVCVSGFQPSGSVDADLVVLAVKERYDPREVEEGAVPDWLPRDLRYVGLLQDLPLVRDVCSTLRGFSGILLVLSNPVDLMTALVGQWLPSARVVGGGLSLDSLRLGFMLSASGVSRSLALGIPLAGEHGREVFPCSSLSGDMGVPGELVSECLKKSLAFGITMMRDLGYTMHDCGSAFAHDIEWLLGCGKSGTTRAFSMPSDGGAIGRPLRREHDGGIEHAALSPAEEVRLQELSARISRLADRTLLESFE